MQRYKEKLETENERRKQKTELKNININAPRLLPVFRKDLLILLTETTAMRPDRHCRLRHMGKLTD